MTLTQITDQLLKDLDGLRFGPPVTHVYNPLTYAGEAYARYLALYGNTPKEVLLLGMNPGPWGMAQTGVPFGEVRLVRDWLEIEVPITAPAATHPKRPVTGFACTRSEVSGARLWGWIRETFQTPERFFARFFVANYCPLIFIEASGRNRTPDHLPQAQRLPLLAACDRALRRSVAVLSPQYVVGVGRFAETRALEALRDLPVTIGRLTHPSPANPTANRGWGALADRELADLGIRLETPRDP